MTAKRRRGRHPADPTGEIFGDTHWPLPDRYTTMPPSYIALDKEELLFIGRGEYGTVWDESVKSTAPEDVVIGFSNSLKTYSVLEMGELRTLYRNTTGSKAPKGASYPELLDLCCALGESVEPYPTPDHLMAAAHKQEVQENSVAPPKKSREKKPKSTSVAPRSSKRPKEGSTTARVWDLADEAFAKDGTLDKKELRSLVLLACEKAGINKSTASVQFGKWWGSK